MIEVDTSEFERWLQQRTDKLRAGAERALVLSAQGAAFHAKATKKFKNRTGELRSSIRVKNTGGLTAEVVADAKHAFWVENGNKPASGDRIYPKNAKALRFEINGTVFFRRWVRPAAPRKFMQEARDAAVPLFERLLSTATATAFE